MSWEKEVRTHDRAVFLSLLAKGVLPAEARDITQETWMLLWQKVLAGGLREIQLPGLAIRQAAWLAQTRRRGEKRRDKREQVSSQVGGGIGSGSEADGDLGNAEGRFLAHMDLVRVRELVTQLPPSARQVFQKLYVPPVRSPREAAKELGLSVQRIRQLHSEIRSTFRAEFKNSEENEESLGGERR